MAARTCAAIVQAKCRLRADIRSEQEFYRADIFSSRGGPSSMTTGKIVRFLWLARDGRAANSKFKALENV